MLISIGGLVVAVIVLLWVICDHVRRCGIELHNHFEDNHRAQAEEIRKLREDVRQLAEVVEKLKR